MLDLSGKPRICLPQRPEDNLKHAVRTSRSRSLSNRPGRLEASTRCASSGWQHQFFRFPRSLSRRRRKKPLGCLGHSLPRILRLLKWQPPSPSQFQAWDLAEDGSCKAKSQKSRRVVHAPCCILTQDSLSLNRGRCQNELHHRKQRAVSTPAFRSFPGPAARGRRGRGLPLWLLLWL